MNKLFWSFHVLVTLAMGLFGAQKVAMPIDDLISFGMIWIEDFPAWQVRTIGALEVLGALGLNLPYFVKSLPKALVPAAAGGLALTMIGAIALHVSRGDPAPSIVITSALFAMCTALAVRGYREMRAVSTSA